MHRLRMATIAGLFVFFFLIAGSYAHAATQTVFDWKFNETSGTVAYDSSGNGYNGTIYNNPTFLSGGGFGFNGVNQYVETINPVYNSLGSTSQAYTLTAKVEVATTSENGNIIHVADHANGIGWCIPMLGVSAGHFRAYGWTGSAVFATATSTATPGQWYTIANTYDPVAGTLNLYVNGTLVASSSMSTYAASGAPDYIFAGFSPGSGCSGDLGFFAGNIRDVTITSNALTQNDVNNLNNPSPAFTPTNNATNVATSSSLTLDFGSGTIATSTGSIVIKKTSDDSTVETIPLTSPHITQPTSHSFIIQPSAPFAESTSYYISIPGTAFEDASSSLFYLGTTGSSTWSFMTGDFTAPTVTSIVSSPAATSSAITWTTNELASTKVIYSTDTSYSSTTSETNISPRVLNHTLSLAGLLSCTLYNYKVVSADASRNYATSTPLSFTTTGCSSSASIGASSGTLYGYSSGGSIAQQVHELLSFGNTARASSIEAQWPTLFPSASSSAPSSARPSFANPSSTMTFTRNMKLGMTGSDVLALQKYLNAHGFLIAPNGPGSVGQETELFGSLTKAALIAFQKASGITPASGYFGSLTRAYVASHD